MSCYLHTLHTFCRVCWTINRHLKKKIKGELYENLEWKLSPGLGVSSPSFQNKVLSGPDRSWWQTLLHGVKAKWQEAGKSVFCTGLMRLRLQTRPCICVQRAISTSTPKGPVSPKGSSIVPLGRKKSGCFSVGPCRFFLFTHPCSLHFVPDERQVRWCFLLKGGEPGCYCSLFRDAARSISSC